MKLKLILVFTSLFAATSAFSQWAGEGNLSYSNAKGNSNTSALAASLNLSKESGQWKHSAGFDALGSTQDDTTTGESYTLAGQSDYNFSGSYFGFGGLRYQKDRFSGYDNQASATAGLGWNAIDNGTTTFDISLGAGYRESELSNNGGSTSEAVGSLSLVYKQTLTETTDFDVSYLTESGSSNTYSEVNAAIRVAMSDALGLRAGYLIKHNSDAPAGSKATDTLMTVGVSYNF